MTVLSAQTLRRIRPVEPFCERTTSYGLTFGCGPAGYDVRVAEHVHLHLDGLYLASTVERFAMPDDVLAVVHDKSTWARRGVLVQNTIVEPGWCGYLTLELTFHRLADAKDAPYDFVIEAGSPIAQIVFHRLDEPTDSPYRGRYQDQKSGPQPARLTDGTII